MFRFRLQRLLELREQHEQARARELASARGVAEQASKKEELLEQIKQESLSQLRSAAVDAPRVGLLHQLGTALTSLDERLTDAKSAVKEADDGVRQAQELLDAAARDRRVLDRLKSRHADIWRIEESFKDRNRMDEVALMQYARKAGGSPSKIQETEPRTKSPETHFK